MGQIHIRIDGLSALLMHNGALLGRGGGTGRKTIPTPEVEAAASRYLMPDSEDELGIPTIALRNCLLSGAKGIRVKKSSLISQMTGGIRIEPEDGMVALTRKGKPITAYVVDTRRAVVQRQGILRSRAKVVPPWSVEFDLLWDEQVIRLAPDVFCATLREDIATAAGTTIGLLDYRPEKRGWFGKWVIGELEIVA